MGAPGEIVAGGEGGGSGGQNGVLGQLLDSQERLFGVAEAVLGHGGVGEGEGEGTGRREKGGGWVLAEVEEEGAF